MTAAAFSDAARDLTRSKIAVREGAATALRDVTTTAAAALRATRAPYPYRYATRIAAAAKATSPREQAAGQRIAASVKVGGRRVAFSGGASVSVLVWGAEFGAKSGDVVRVRLSTGRTQSIAAGSFDAYRRNSERQWTRAGRNGRRRAVVAGAPGGERTRVTGVRRGGLGQFPTRTRDGWFLTPTLDGIEDDMWATTDAEFTDAVDGW